MKIKYLRLPKVDKKKLQELYYATENGKLLKKRLLVVMLAAFGLLICSLAIIFDTYYNNHSIWNYIYAGFLFLSSLAFFISSYKLRIKRLNDYLIKNKIKL